MSEKTKQKEMIDRSLIVSRNLQKVKQGADPLQQRGCLGAFLILGSATTMFQLPNPGQSSLSALLYTLSSAVRPNLIHAQADVKS